MRKILGEMLHLTLWIAIWLVLWIGISFIVLAIYSADPHIGCGLACLDYVFGFLAIACGINPFIALGLTGYLYFWIDNRREKSKRKNDFIESERLK
jgi:hypothetical protein